MSVLAFVAAGAVGSGAAGLAGMIRPPTRHLAPRVRPYALVARSALGHPPEPSSTLESPGARDAILGVCSVRRFAPRRRG